MYSIPGFRQLHGLIESMVRRKFFFSLNSKCRGDEVALRRRVTEARAGRAEGGAPSRETPIIAGAGANYGISLN